MIAAYRFADPTKRKFRRFDGRTGLSKEIKEQLIQKYGCRCFIYLETIAPADLQIDHRVPYEVAGDSDELKADEFMLFVYRTTYVAVAIVTTVEERLGAKLD